MTSDGNFPPERFDKVLETFFCKGSAKSFSFPDITSALRKTLPEAFRTNIKQKKISIVLKSTTKDCTVDRVRQLYAAKLLI
jgi:hypothetical protein